MENLLYTIRVISEFICVYTTMKALISCFLSLFVMLMIPVIRRINCKRYILIDYGAVLLILPMLFTGMSRLMYMRYTSRVYIIISRMAQGYASRIYAGGAGIFLITYAIRNIRHRAGIRTLKEADGRYRTICDRAIHTVYGDNRNKCFCRRPDHISVYITEKCISPYSGGLFKPYIVMPDRSVINVTDREYNIMLCHEYMHHKKLHILWLTLFDIACIYWWFNPFIYLYRELFRDDMELMCDNACIELDDIDEREYADTVVNMLTVMRRKESGSVAAYFTDGYNMLRKRINAIAVHGRTANTGTNATRLTACRAAVVTATALLISGIAATSYPRYTNMRGLALYTFDESAMKAIPVENDTERLRSSCTVENGALTVTDRELFSQILADCGIKDDYVYLSYDTIMKIPGVGGCGNVGMINTSDYDDIFYLSDDSMLNEFMTIIFKLA